MIFYYINKHATYKVRFIPIGHLWFEHAQTNEVVTFAYRWSNYNPLPRTSGGVAVPVRVIAEHRQSFDAKD